MMTVNRFTGTYHDSAFRELPSLLHKGDVLVLNDSRVIPARLYARRSGLRTQASSQSPTGRIEVLLTQPLGNGEWSALVRPGRKVPVGETLLFSPTEDAPPLLQAEVIASGDFGERTLRFLSTADFFDHLDKLGHMPLPPYIHRSDAQSDRERYQTVFSNERGSAAAPTAGLHFTPAILDQIRDHGVEVHTVTLHVGLGTFQPVRVERVEDIHLHEEHYTLPASTSEAINRAKREGRRIVAAGTTTVRTLEYCARISTNNELTPHTGSTSIFLSPGERFHIVDALLTNFHLSQSTLLMLVCAFAADTTTPQAGIDNILRAYQHAVTERYRFFSYGDCMFLS